MTSSAKPEVHKVSRNADSEVPIKFGEVRPCDFRGIMRADIQTDRQTHTHHNTWHPPQGEVIDDAMGTTARRKAGG